MPRPHLRPRYHVLPPIPRRIEDYERIEEKLVAMMRAEVYLPLMRELGRPGHALRNSLDDLVDAVFTARIQYVDGHFEGPLDAGISSEIRKLGGTWNRARGWWELDQKLLPLDLRSAIGASRSKFEEMARKVDARLEKSLLDLRDPGGGWISGGANIRGERAAQIATQRLRIVKAFDDTIYRADTDFRKNVAKVTIAPVLTPDARARIAAEYSENLQIYVSDFMSEQVLDLRKKVMDQAALGGRYEGLVEAIQQSYGVSLRKAKFLARQETSLLMTKYKQVRYTEAGVPDYKWVCVKMPKDSSPDHHVRGNVRYYHGILDGKTFQWNTGAPVDAHGTRKNPGQDYNCRCNACAIVRF